MIAIDIKKKLKKSIQRNPYKNEINKVSLFGSYVNGKPRKNSDIDVLIEFTPTARVGYFKLAEIQREMNNAVKKKIDLLTPEAVSKYFRAEVLKQAETIYEKR